ncbi:M48 family metallopeptidase [Arcobacter sp. FWKO B]|uniref:M48 family metallopeptidase n=1 Tax=Arcobacter sp. FWKO B TaxID=2593672 RepID=UPI0018A3A391|nr:SprT family zinc-dependent metalloprotease [Arcobacter sp. FWKO B]QOG13070.1 M48 family metallopeptidase [Arcobacter sp. FWKO B]
MKITIIKKKIKNSYIKILPTAEVQVSVPKHASQFYIDNLIESKKEWIYKKIDFVSNKINYNKPLNLVDGDELYYMGQKYNLQILKSCTNSVYIDTEYIILTTKIDTFEYKKKLIDKFYLENAKIILTEILNNYQQMVKKNINCVKIRKMSSRWGSCNYIKKNINLNSELIKKPLGFIEYVVLHELAHLTHPNHSRDFYSYIEEFMPDWKMKCKL